MDGEVSTVEVAQMLRWCLPVSIPFFLPLFLSALCCRRFAVVGRSWSKVRLFRHALVVFDVC